MHIVIGFRFLRASIECETSTYSIELSMAHPVFGEKCRIYCREDVIAGGSTLASF
jgi:hypothetical protein